MKRLTNQIQRKQMQVLEVNEHVGREPAESLGFWLHFMKALVVKIGRTQEGSDIDLHYSRWKRRCAKG